MTRVVCRNMRRRECKLFITSVTRRLSPNQWIIRVFLTMLIFKTYFNVSYRCDYSWHTVTTPGTGLLLARCEAVPKVGDYSWHGTTPGTGLLLARDYSWPVTPEAGGRKQSAVDKSAMRRFASFFVEVLLYQHQRIATMTKMYIASNSIHVEIIRFHTIIETLVTFETRQQRALILLLLWMLSVQNWTHSAQQNWTHSFYRASLSLHASTSPKTSLQAPSRL